MSEAVRNGEDEALVGLATRLADGEPVDWESEEVRTPDLLPEIRNLRWLERMVADHSEDPTASRPGDLEARTLEIVESRAAPIVLAPGATWGPLTILEKIGSGGAGDVYRAYDASLEREVALKLWRETETRKTTGTEARRLAKVRHPVILTVHGTGRHDGYAGMWTDMVLGKNLEEILRETGPFDVAEACRIGVALCDALAAMHGAKLVHRDVKTTNVMREADGRVILMDFGSVKELLRGMPEHTDRMRGTPLTMAPEVFRGEPIGPAADVYALGVLLYRLVSGAYPIEAKSMADLADGHRLGRAVPLRKRRPDLPESFINAVDQALNDEPGKRPQSMEGFRKMLAMVGVASPSSWLGGLVARLRRLVQT